jgi:paraquat-inducible protein B
VNDEILEVKIKKRQISLAVWLVPILALIVGGWMIYKYYTRLGPMIEITFKQSGGLEPKNSYVKFRDVKVGVVERIEILKRSEGVRVHVRMNKDVEPFLNETTKFWIVKPEIGAGKIRGLDALVSGSYIQMYAKLGKESKYYFKGLDEPPLNVGEVPGSTFRLISKSSYDLSAGSAVYYKEMEVGKVEKVRLAPDGKRVYVYVFIKKPYDRFVNSTTKFWKIGAVRVVLGEGGLDVQMRSLSQIVAGGVEFATKDLTSFASSGDYYLYPSKEEANRKRIGVGQEDFREFLMRFDENVGYLRVGAPVKLDGFVVGKVEDIVSGLDVQKRKVDSYVITSIDLSSFKQSLEDDGFKNLEALVRQGLKARLEESNPILGSIYVNLVFTDSNATLKKMGEIYVFPTAKAKRNRVVALVEEILKKINNMPIEETLHSITKMTEEARKPLKESLLAMKRSLEDLDAILRQKEMKSLPRNIEKSLLELEATMKSYKELARSYGKSSLFKDRLDALLRDLDSATKEARKLLRKLDKKPNAIIFGD